MGKKPKNENPIDSIPDTEKADVTEDTPGIGIISWLLFLAIFTNSPAGSDTPGEPASVKNPISLFVIRSRNLFLLSNLDLKN